LENIPFHPLAEIFPLIHGKEFVELKQDIKANGVHEPIVMYQGQILDGRNRFRACQEVGVTPKFVNYAGDSPAAFVISLNIHRRHMDSGQKAAVAVEFLPYLEEESRKRMSSGGKGVEKIPPLEAGKSRDKAAEMVGTNPRYVSDAKKIKEEKPEVFEEIKAGTKSLMQAKRDIREEKREERREENRKKVAESPAPEKLLGHAKFSTILVDPPWDWADEGDINQMGRAKPDYATMTIDQLLGLPVGELADTDCHLYLWITNRSLPKGFQLLDRWGFRYITAITWVKPSFGMGNYFRGQTEHVLFGVRGSQMLKRQDVGTVFNAARGAGGHSSKPVEFYDLVESCSPGPYLEMFSRCDRKDWTAWGEQSNAA
jgi:N6-adenosine-specific RNA methylase IME4